MRVSRTEGDEVLCYASRSSFLTVAGSAIVRGVRALAPPVTAVPPPAADSAALSRTVETPGTGGGAAAVQVAGPTAPQKLQREARRWVVTYTRRSCAHLMLAVMAINNVHRHVTAPFTVRGSLTISAVVAAGACGAFCIRLFQGHLIARCLLAAVDLIAQGTLDKGIAAAPWGTDTKPPTVLALQGVKDPIPDTKVPSRYGIAQSTVLFVPERLPGQDSKLQVRNA